MFQRWYSLPWDPVVRVTHWLIAGLFLTNYWLTEAGDPPHEWVGYGLVGVLLTRLLWGFVGPDNARISGLFPTPARVKSQLRNFRQSYAKKKGHTPLSGLMILFTWLMLLLICLSGWLQTTDRYWGEEWVENLHELSTDTLMVVIVVHIVTVFLLGYWLKRSLVRPMIFNRTQRSNSTLEE